MVSIPTENVALWVAEIAKAHGVTDECDEYMRLADTITALSGDDVALDSVSRMLVKLKEKGVFSGEDIIHIKAAEIKERHACSPTFLLEEKSPLPLPALTPKMTYEELFDEDCSDS